MMDRDSYSPAPAGAKLVNTQGESWTFVLAKQLRHPPEKVWLALTDPAHLREWAPFDADGKLDQTANTVKLTTVGTPQPYVSETKVTRADAPHLLEYSWGGNALKWELEDYAGGTRLTLWASIDRRYIAMGAAGWQICLDVLDHHLAGAPLGRIAGPEAMKLSAWQQLNAEYAKRFALEITAPRSNA
jgi:uncharacterized protein YndB with AHSA1/START domain